MATEKRSLNLIIECLAREMQLAQRWHTVEELWMAMTHVRRMHSELERPAPSGQDCGEAVPTRLIRSGSMVKGE